MKKLLLLAACLCGAYLSAESVILTPENCVIKPFRNSGTAEYKAATEKVFTEICALGGYTRSLPAVKNPTDTEDAE